MQAMKRQIFLLIIDIFNLKIIKLNEVTEMFNQINLTDSDVVYNSVDSIPYASAVDK
jgi:hypothetical protein